MKFVYIVIATKKEDERWHIDSTWTSRRKAMGRCNTLNSDREYLEEFGYFKFEVSSCPISK